LSRLSILNSIKISNDISTKINVLIWINGGNGPVYCRAHARQTTTI
jgi:hypothetical protein